MRRVQQDPILDDDHKMLARTLRTVVDQEIIPLEPLHKGLYELPEEVKRPVQEKLRAAGLWQPLVPKEYGGGGVDQIGAAIVTEETNRSLLARDILGPTPDVVWYLGSDEIKNKYLYPALEGKRHGFAAFSEPDAGGDLAGIQATAKKVKGGYLLNGTKSWVSNAIKSDFGHVLARMEGTKRHDGLTLFMVNKEMPGFEVVREIQAMGYLESWGELRFSDCFVPASHRLTPEGQGWGVSQDRWTGMRCRIGARCLGLAGRCQEMALRYSKSRRTFGSPLSDRQAVQFMLADSEIELHAIRLMTYHAAWNADHGIDIRHEASIIKVFAAEMAERVIDRALQIHGASGYSRDLPIEAHYRAIRAQRILEGPSELHRWIVARDILRNVG